MPSRRALLGGGVPALLAARAGTQPDAAIAGRLRASMAEHRVPATLVPSWGAELFERHGQGTFPPLGRLAFS